MRRSEISVIICFVFFRDRSPLKVNLSLLSFICSFGYSHKVCHSNCNTTFICPTTYHWLSPWWHVYLTRLLRDSSTVNSVLDFLFFLGLKGKSLLLLTFPRLHPYSNHINLSSFSKTNFVSLVPLLTMFCLVFPCLLGPMCPRTSVQFLKPNKRFVLSFGDSPKLSPDCT